MDVVDSLTKSLETINQCIGLNSDVTAQLQEYVSEADRRSARIRRSVMSVHPFGEFRAGRLPIHDNNHTTQRDAFAERFLQSMGQRSDWTAIEIDVLQSSLDILYPIENLDSSQVNWESVAAQCRQLSRSFNRSTASCHSEYIHNLDINGNRDWTEADDHLLSRLVDEYKGTNWEEIGRQLKRPTASCYIRCYANVHPVLVPVDFTKEDDLRLMEAVEKLGDAGWGIIASELGTGHTDRQCMNRWTKTLMPGIQPGRWNPVLDARLKAAVAIYGESNWVEVSRHVTGKTARKCRERYFESLREGLRPTTEWTVSEDEAFEKSIRKHGVGKWSRIAQDLTGRTDRMCFLRFNKLSNEGLLEDLKQQYTEMLMEKRESKLARTRGSPPAYSQKGSPEQTSRRGRPPKSEN
jgi:hypothetical protein